MPWIRAFSVAAFAALAITSTAQAATETPFTQAAFAAAQAKGQPILVDIKASWCPTCARQAPIINGLLDTPEFKDYARFAVDFDSQKNVVRGFKATTQSTLIVYRGRAEQGRSTGDTNEASIKALLQRASR